MTDTTTADGQIARALSWISTRGIEIRSWPPPTPDHVVDFTSVPPADPADRVQPVLYLVEPGMEPPICRDLEDWVRIPIDVGELTARGDRLIAWSRDLGAVFTRIDDDDLLWVGDEMVVLSPLEARLMRVLIGSMGMLVLREDLMDAVWPDGPPSDPRALDNRVKAVRARISGLPLCVHTVHGRGLVLEHTAG